MIRKFYGSSLVEGTVRGGGIREENFAAGFAGWVGSRRATSAAAGFYLGEKLEGDEGERRDRKSVV